MDTPTAPVQALSPSSLLAMSLLQPNGTGMDVELWDLSQSQTYRWVLWVQTILEPFIILFGLLGNTLAVTTLMTKHLRVTSCCLYLAAKCVGDAVFLGVLFVVWLFRVHARVINHAGICQVSSVSFTSVWLIVLVSHENFVRISRPHLVKVYCTPRRAGFSIALVFISAAIIYSFHLWITQVQMDENGEMSCVAVAR
ncbi:uncharacterized protein LOC131949972 [Physella acuta]|uniref:uncharacterized protein LOC131949972 n=1 Tax=Physella acuta TaxID=109671 RepID=UPI0027DD5883|nr:uncharacterized protein LOC131949972 [Physella acuta]